MNSDDVIFLAINLADSQNRRDNLKRQEEAQGIRIQLVEAISGSSLTDEQKAMYQEKERSKVFPLQMTLNEQACVHSHRKAMEVFLKSKAKYGIIMEDDVDFCENLVEKISYLIDRIGGWECAKLYSINCKKYNLIQLPQNAPVAPVFPRNNSCGAVCYIYSRKTAQTILNKTKTFFLEADNLIAKILLEESIPTIGTTPNLAGTIDPHHENSDIDRSDARFTRKKNKRSFMQYIRTRMNKLKFTLGKGRMIKLLRKSLYIR